MPIEIKRKGRPIAISKLEEMQPDDVVPFELSPIFLAQNGFQIQHLLFLECLETSTEKFRLFIRPTHRDQIRLLVYEQDHLVFGKNGLKSTDGSREDGFYVPYSDSLIQRTNYYIARSALRQAGLLAIEKVQQNGK